MSASHTSSTKASKQFIHSRSRMVLASAISAMLITGCASKATDQTEAQDASVAKVEQQSAAPDRSSQQQSKAEAEKMMNSLATTSEAKAEPAAPPAEEKKPVASAVKTAKPVVEKTVSAPAQKVVKAEPVKPASQNVQATEEKAEAAPVEAPQPVQTPQPSASEKAAAAVASLAAPEKKLKSKGKAFDVSKKDLPVTHGIWKIKRGEALMDKDIVISTPTWEMGKPGYMSQIWVTIMDDKVLINSSSDIDVKQGKTGIRLDDGQLVPFSRIEGNNIGILDGDWLDRLEQGKKLDIYMGFFPDRKPRSETFHSEVALDGLSRIVPTYRNLIK
ncbi:MAG: hypothetical protein R3183_01600 [Oleiphilaceae bacterium]|nr:hypothetical protein [Oleiphilaceae bacterium]